MLDAKKLETLACVASGIIESRSLVLGDIGRAVPSGAYDKHKIKRVDRFLSNTGFDVDAVSRGLLRSLAFVPHQRVLLALDWTKLGKLWMMTASVVLGSRSLPFHWTIVNQKRVRLAVAQKWHVEGLLDLLPSGVEYVLLFDAGYDDVDFVKFLMAAEIKFVVRCSSTPSIRPEGRDEWIKLAACSFERGRLYDWRDVEFTIEHELLIRFVAIHDHKQKGPWRLLTNLQDDAQRIVTYYGRRFETEETYKDFKDVRSGFQLKGTRVLDPRRLIRLVAAMTVAYYLMVCAGLYGEDLGLHRQMQTNTVKHKRVLALWRVGRNLIRQGRVSRQHLLGRLWLLIDSLSISFGGLQCQASG
jgi:hypothetical protein